MKCKKNIDFICKREVDNISYQRLPLEKPKKYVIIEISGR